jgi:hypothetical protein
LDSKLCVGLDNLHLDFINYVYFEVNLVYDYKSHGFVILSYSCNLLLFNSRHLSVYHLDKCITKSPSTFKHDATPKMPLSYYRHCLKPASLLSLRDRVHQKVRSREDRIEGELIMMTDPWIVLRIYRLLTVYHRKCL